MNSASRRSGQRHHGDGEEKAEMDPGQVARALADVIELGLLARPEDAQGEEAHQVGHPLGAKSAKREQKIAFRTHLGGGGNVDVQHQQGHRHGEDAIAYRGQPVEVAALDAVIYIVHKTVIFLHAKQTLQFVSLGFKR